MSSACARLKIVLPWRFALVCRYEEGYSGKEDNIQWFWDAVETLDDPHRRLLLQFWSGSDGMPAEGFGGWGHVELKVWVDSSGWNVRVDVVSSGPSLGAALGLVSGWLKV